MLCYEGVASQRTRWLAPWASSHRSNAVRQGRKQIHHLKEKRGMTMFKKGVIGFAVACSMFVAAPALAEAPAKGVQAQGEVEPQGRELRCGVNSDGVVYCEIVIKF